MTSKITNLVDATAVEQTLTAWHAAEAAATEAEHALNEAEAANDALDIPGGEDVSLQAFMKGPALVRQARRRAALAAAQAAEVKATIGNSDVRLAQIVAELAESALDYIPAIHVDNGQNQIEAEGSYLVVTQSRPTGLNTGVGSLTSLGNGRLDPVRGGYLTMIERDPRYPFGEYGSPTSPVTLKYYRVPGLAPLDLAGLVVAGKAADVTLLDEDGGDLLLEVNTQAGPAAGTYVDTVTLAVEAWEKLPVIRERDVQGAAEVWLNGIAARAKQRSGKYAWSSAKVDVTRTPKTRTAKVDGFVAFSNGGLDRQSVNQIEAEIRTMLLATDGHPVAALGRCTSVQVERVFGDAAAVQLAVKATFRAAELAAVEVSSEPDEDADPEGFDLIAELRADRARQVLAAQHPGTTAS